MRTFFLFGNFEFRSKNHLIFCVDISFKIEKKHYHKKDINDKMLQFLLRTCDHENRFVFVVRKNTILHLSLPLSFHHFDLIWSRLACPFSFYLFFPPFSFFVFYYMFIIRFGFYCLFRSDGISNVSFS